MRSQVFFCVQVAAASDEATLYLSIRECPRSQVFALPVALDEAETYVFQDVVAGATVGSRIHRVVKIMGEPDPLDLVDGLEWIHVPSIEVQEVESKNAIRSWMVIDIPLESPLMVSHVKVKLWKFLHPLQRFPELLHCTISRIDVS